MSNVNKINKFQEIQDSLTRVRKRVMAIGAYKGCMHTALAAVNDLAYAEERLEAFKEEIINKKEVSMSKETNDLNEAMEVTTSYKLPTFEFEKQDSWDSDLSYGAKFLLRLLNEYKNDEAYNLIEGFIPLDYKELQTELNCSVEDIESYFKELERNKSVSRCTARFICVNEQKGGAK